MTKKSEIIVKDFSAKWCTPCKIQTPIIKTLKEKYPTINFELIDIDKNSDESDRFEIKAIPTIIIQNDGVIVKRFVGMTVEKDIKKVLDELLLNNKKK